MKVNDQFFRQKAKSTLSMIPNLEPSNWAGIMFTTSSDKFNTLQSFKQKKGSLQGSINQSSIKNQLLNPNVKQSGILKEIQRDVSYIKDQRGGSVKLSPLEQSGPEPYLPLQLEQIKKLGASIDDNGLPFAVNSSGLPNIVTCLKEGCIDLALQTKKKRRLQKGKDKKQIFSQRILMEAKTVDVEDDKNRVYLGKPSGRQDIINLRQWLRTVKQMHLQGIDDIIHGENVQEDHEKLIEDADDIYSVLGKELVRQISVYCIDRGEVLKELLKYYSKSGKAKTQLQQFYANRVQERHAKEISDIKYRTAQQIALYQVRLNDNVQRITGKEDKIFKYKNTIKMLKERLEELLKQKDSQQRKKQKMLLNGPAKPSAIELLSSIFRYEKSPPRKEHKKVQTDVEEQKQRTNNEDSLDLQQVLNFQHEENANRRWLIDQVLKQDDFIRGPQGRVDDINTSKSSSHIKPRLTHPNISRKKYPKRQSMDQPKRINKKSINDRRRSMMSPAISDKNENSDIQVQSIGYRQHRRYGALLIPSDQNNLGSKSHQNLFDPIGIQPERVQSGFNRSNERNRSTSPISDYKQTEMIMRAQDFNIQKRNRYSIDSDNNQFIQNEEYKSVIPYKQSIQGRIIEKEDPQDENSPIFQKQSDSQSPTLITVHPPQSNQDPNQQSSTSSNPTHIKLHPTPDDSDSSQSDISQSKPISPPHRSSDHSLKSLSPSNEFEKLSTLQNLQREIEEKEKYLNTLTQISQMLNTPSESSITDQNLSDGSPLNKIHLLLQTATQINGYDVELNEIMPANADKMSWLAGFASGFDTGKYSGVQEANELNRDETLFIQNQAYIGFVPGSGQSPEEDSKSPQRTQKRQDEPLQPSPKRRTTKIEAFQFSKREPVFQVKKVNYGPQLLEEFLQQSYKRNIKGSTMGYKMVIKLLTFIHNNALAKVKGGETLLSLSEHSYDEFSAKFSVKNVTIKKYREFLCSVLSSNQYFRVEMFLRLIGAGEKINKTNYHPLTYNYYIHAWRYMMTARTGIMLNIDENAIKSYFPYVRAQECLRDKLEAVSDKAKYAEAQSRLEAISFPDPKRINIQGLVEFERFLEIFCDCMDIVIKDIVQGVQCAVQGLGEADAIRRSDICLILSFLGLEYDLSRFDDIIEQGAFEIFAVENLILRKTQILEHIEFENIEEGMEAIQKGREEFKSMSKELGEDWESLLGKIEIAMGQDYIAGGLAWKVYYSDFAKRLSGKSQIFKN